MAVVGSGGTIVRRCLSLPGGVFEQDGEDSAQPVPGVGRRVDIDPDHPQLRGFPGGPPLSVLSLGFFQSRCSRRNRLLPTRQTPVGHARRTLVLHPVWRVGESSVIPRKGLHGCSGFRGTSSM